MAAEINIVIADDHCMLANGLALLIAEETDMAVTAVCSNGKTLMASLREHAAAVDVVILDINMPELDGLTALPMIVSGFPDIKVLVLSMYTSAEIIRRVQKAGAQGFLYKGAETALLIAAVREIHAGGTAFEQEKRGHAAELTDDAFIKLSTLSPREKEVAKLIRDGQTTPRIAQQLFIAEYTVNTHRKNIIHKLGLKSTAELIKFATENNL
ncbi:response regulator transcription factor [Chitinophaga defluvii]|uniref:Response regulator transcription factor n=1 Tax=Chitinophaga defluvii TaxID=3163343 RepID=A0ABV2TAH8_9BACT